MRTLVDLELRLRLRQKRLYPREVSSHTPGQCHSVMRRGVMFSFPPGTTEDRLRKLHAQQYGCRRGVSRTQMSALLRLRARCQLCCGIYMQ